MPHPRPWGNPPAQNCYRFQTPAWTGLCLQLLPRLSRFPHAPERQTFSFPKAAARGGPNRGIRLRVRLCLCPLFSSSDFSGLRPHPTRSTITGNASNSRLTASKARLRLFGGKDLKTNPCERFTCEMLWTAHRTIPVFPCSTAVRATLQRVAVFVSAAFSLSSSSSQGVAHVRR
jgi:hypothetical protein